MISFKDVDSKNEGNIHSLYPGDDGKYWVNFNWYWLELSSRRPHIYSKLIYLENVDEPIGFIAYGQHYKDRLLKEAVENTWEFYHIVVHEPFQGRGIGKASTIVAAKKIINDNSCEKLVVACHPDNKSATELYKKLGFSEIGQNYDEDPIYVLNKTDILKLNSPKLEQLSNGTEEATLNESWSEECLQYKKEFNWDDWEAGLET